MTSRYRLLVPVGAAVALGVSAFLPVNPLANPDDNFGNALLPLPPVVATVWLLVAAVGLLAAVLALHTSTHRTRTWVVGSATVVALLLLDQGLLTALGYLPASIVLLVTGRFDILSLFLSPGLALQALVVAAGAVLLLELWHRRPDTSVDADEALATRRTRKWTLIAIEAPLVYALSRVLMFLQVPGFTSPEFGPMLRWAGLGLAGAACVGALLTWGLVAPWGSRFPRRLPGLGGRAVPVRLAVLPALVVAVLIMAAFRSMALQVLTAAPGELAGAFALPLVLLPHLLWPVWSVALALAAVNYGRRRAAAAPADAVAHPTGSPR